jgi:glycine/serine hydroxymethyltransferase
LPINHDFVATVLGEALPQNRASWDTITYYTITIRLGTHFVQDKGMKMNEFNNYASVTNKYSHVFSTNHLKSQDRLGNDIGSIA